MALLTATFAFVAYLSGAWAWPGGIEPATTAGRNALGGAAVAAFFVPLVSIGSPFVIVAAIFRIAVRARFAREAGDRYGLDADQTSAVLAMAR
ncbi:hypothetical protein [Sandaracinus amylolyticus]|uniref:hypothetical protein n=1 Tax=Sandaracinus amylolyticus TaxID=927083 RepID=UPI001F48DDF9|nr:hypothetical protein [Sandaracinus amylolyticus]UJR83217.1 Hypothetical protein I5071_52830 [Sandaracinus amylolyticus]